MINRAERVARLIGDPDLAAAFESVRQAILQRIEECPLRDTEGAERLRVMLKTLRDVRKNLDLAIQDGKIEALRLEQEQQQAKKVRR